MKIQRMKKGNTEIAERAQETRSIMSEKHSRYNIGMVLQKSCMAKSILLCTKHSSGCTVCIIVRRC